jgi:DNA-directed RNA polymerase subunit RPC12/RpoP
MTPELHLKNPLMPQPIDCDRCGAKSIIHTAQYVYQRTHGAANDAEASHKLQQIVMVIECPNCGVRTQTVEAGEDQ